AAGKLPGSLHYRYPTKAGLLLALMKRGMEADLAALRGAIAPSRDPVDRLRLALRARLRLLLSRGAGGGGVYAGRSLQAVLVRPHLRGGGLGPPASRAGPQDAAVPADGRVQLGRAVVLGRRHPHAGRGGGRVLGIHRVRRAGRGAPSRERRGRAQGALGVRPGGDERSLTPP